MVFAAVPLGIVLCLRPIYLADYPDRFVISGFKFQNVAVHSNWTPRTFRRFRVCPVREARRIHVLDNENKERRSSPRAAIGQVYSACV